MVVLHLRAALRALPRSTARRQAFSTHPSLALWNGTTQPVKNAQIPPAIQPNVQQAQDTQRAASSRPSTFTNAATTTTTTTTTTTPSATVAAAAAVAEGQEVRRVHTKFIQDLLSRASSSDVASFAAPPQKTKGIRQRTRQHSLSEPLLFRTDGPLTPYPISLDTGEQLEPKHATLVRVVDKGGERRTIVVAELDDDTGKQRSILLALDVNEPDEVHLAGAVGRRISAEEMYATLGIEGKS